MPTFVLPKTFVAGDYLTFTELNAAIGQGGSLAWCREALRQMGIDADSGQQTVNSAMTGCRVFGEAQQIPDSQWTEVAWSTQRFGRADGRDVDFLLSEYPTFVHLPITPADQMNGYFLIGAHIAWAGNTTGKRGMRLVSHGNKIAVDSYTTQAGRFVEATAAGAYQSQSIMTIDGVNAGGGSYALQVWQDSGDTLELQAVPGSSPEFWVYKCASTTAT